MYVFLLESTTALKALFLTGTDTVSVVVLFPGIIASLFFLPVIQVAPLDEDINVLEQSGNDYSTQDKYVNKKKNPQ